LPVLQPAVAAAAAAGTHPVELFQARCHWLLLVHCLHCCLQLGPCVRLKVCRKLRLHCNMDKRWECGNHSNSAPKVSTTAIRLCTFCLPCRQLPRRYAVAAPETSSGCRTDQLRQGPKPNTGLHDQQQVLCARHPISYGSSVDAALNVPGHAPTNHETGPGGTHT
jgi:hypothetical protein